MSHMTRASPGSKFYETAGKQGLMLSKDWEDHYEEKINFIPFSFLNDVPNKRKNLSEMAVFKKLLENNSEYIHCCHRIVQ